MCIDAAAGDLPFFDLPFWGACQSSVPNLIGRLINRQNVESPEFKYDLTDDLRPNGRAVENRILSFKSNLEERFVKMWVAVFPEVDQVT